MKFRRLISLITVIGICAGTIIHICSCSFSAKADDTLTNIQSSTIKNSYQEYITANNNAQRPNHKAECTPTTELAVYEGFEGVLMNDVTSADFSVEVNQAGLYAIEIAYIAVSGNNLSVEYKFLLDGNYPFSEAEDLELTKLYKDSGEPQTDSEGNEIRPEQEEVINLQTVCISDPVGYVQEPFMFYFETGKHILSFKSVRGEVLIKSVALVQPDKVYSEKEYAEKIDENSEIKNEEIRIDAEKPYIKSSSMLYASCDKTSLYIDPYPKGKEKLNVLGGANFSSVGQWVEYQFEVEKNGYYYLDIKYKQNISIGMSSYRNIYIDNKMLSESFRNIAFSYTNKWKSLTVSDNSGKAVPIYLDKGIHTVRMEVTLGEYNDILAEIEASVAAFNAAYLESIMYLTSSPDTNRDYDVKKNLPNVLAVFKEQIKVLENLSEKIYEVGGGTNNSIAIMEQMVYQLDNILEEPETYPENLDSVKSNITALATLISSLSSQPLTMDYITFYTPDVELEEPEAGFFKNFYNELVNFTASFASDYEEISDKDYDKEIIVWIPTGRDQYKVLNSLIRNDFSSKSRIKTNLKLVTESGLLPATVAGIGPDVIIQVANGTPMNYAVRGAAFDLSAFEDCDKVLERFSDAAVTPLKLGNSVYGLPETEAFYMMFYRTDVLERLELDVPRTWEDFLVATTELQKNNLTVGLPCTMEAYAMFLMQRGGYFYAEDTYECNLKTTVGVKSFTYFTDLFTNYSLPLSYDALTRFRMGEMPIIIAEYSFFNNLQVGAPEIGNVWKFTQVPGTLTASGDIDNTVTVTGLACMMLNSSKDPESAWEFMKWWTSASTQTSYGRNMEMLLGPSARVATANLESANSLSWSREDAQAIAEARESLKGTENVPGSYFLSRHFLNAFRSVVLSGDEPKESLRYYTKIINNEIHSKCEELGVSIERSKTEEQ